MITKKKYYLEPKDKKEIRDNLRQKGLSMSWLAKKLNYNYGYFLKICNGQFSISPRTLTRLNDMGLLKISEL